MELPDSIEPDQMKSAAIAVMVILGLGAFVAMRFIQKVIVKLFMVAALVGAGVFIYSQRSDLDECQEQLRGVIDAPDEDLCRCDFVGFEVKVPACDAIPGRDTSE